MIREWAAVWAVLGLVVFAGMAFALIFGLLMVCGLPYVLLWPLARYTLPRPCIIEVVTGL